MSNYSFQNQSPRPKAKMAKMSVTSSGPSDDSEEDSGIDFSKLRKVPIRIDFTRVKPLKLITVKTTLNPNVVESSNLTET